MTLSPGLMKPEVIFVYTFFDTNVSATRDNLTLKTNTAYDTTSLSKKVVVQKMNQKCCKYGTDLTSDCPQDWIPMQTGACLAPENYAG